MAEWLDLTKSLVRCGYLILASADMSGEQRVKLVCASLLARSLSNIRGAIVLVEAGRLVEARTLVRCCFENEFWLAALAAKGRAFVEEMMHDEIRARQSSGQFMFEDAQTRESLAPEVEEKVRKWLGQSKKEWPQAATLNPQEVAKRTEVGGAYNFYRQLSGDAAHPSLTSLNRYVEEERGEVVGINADPLASGAELADTLSLGCVALLGACVGASQIFDPEHQIKELGDVWKRHQHLTGLTE